MAIIINKKDRIVPLCGIMLRPGENKVSDKTLEKISLVNAFKTLIKTKKIEIKKEKVTKKKDATKDED